MDSSHDFARLLESYFVERLVDQRRASPQTIASYRDTFRLFLMFTQTRLGKAPSQLALRDIDAPFIGAFLTYLETDRGNSIQTRNVRLAAIRSFYRYVALHEPQLSGQIQRILAIPTKRSTRIQVNYLTFEEASAIIAAPDQSRWAGRRDRALILVAVQTGLRVSELTALKCQDVVLGRSAHVNCTGKGRKNRSMPLHKETRAVLKQWLHERGSPETEPLFPSARGGPLSRDGVAYLLAKHVASARESCPALRKKNVTPHVLRHTAAMSLLQRGVDRSVIALWLGHETLDTVHVYLHANMELKEAALAKTKPINVAAGRYRPEDDLLAFLKSL